MPPRLPALILRRHVGSARYGVLRLDGKRQHVEKRINHALLDALVRAGDTANTHAIAGVVDVLNNLADRKELV